MDDFIRTPRNGCFRVRSNAWGQFLAPCPDPQATAVLEPGALDSFQLHDSIHRIPADLWSRWVQLCFHFAHLRQGDLEVSCRLLRHEEDRSQWRLLIPHQEVSGASVRIDSFDAAIDIATGELVELYPPEGWLPAGSSHSHNTMTLDRFSSIDDASELGCPGLHIVLSHINTTRRTYVATASITANHRRFYLPDAAAVIDLTPIAATFHPAVLEVIQPQRPSRGWLLPVPSPTRQSRSACRTERPAHLSPSFTHEAAREPDSWPTSEAQEDLDWALHAVWEAIQEAFLCAEAYQLDRDDVLAEVIDAIRHSYAQHSTLLDNPLTWLDDHDLDHPSDGTDRPVPSTPQGLPISEW